MFLKKSFLCALLVTSLSTPIYAASNWDDSNGMNGVKTLIENQDYQSAIYELKSMVSKDAYNADAFNLLGFSHRKLKRYEAAEKYYLRALELNPKHKGAMEYLGELYVETKRMDKANEMLIRLDEVCFFKCEEYKQLKGYIEGNKGEMKTSSNW